MFTGIIEHSGHIKNIQNKNANLVFTIERSGLNMKLGDSIAINGTCLTVIKFDDETFEVEAIPETLRLTNLGKLKVGDRVNMEGSVRIGQTLDGHLVSGHVDFTSDVLSIEADGQDSKRIKFSIKSGYEKFIALKGSVTVNGTSLTVSGMSNEWFEVSLIPFTLEQTNLGDLTVGSQVNIEIDLIARYVERLFTTAYENKLK